MIKSLPPDIPLLPYPLHKPLLKKQNMASPNNQNTEINLDIEENSPFQQGNYIRVDSETG